MLVIFFVSISAFKAYLAGFPLVLVPLLLAVIGGISFQISIERTQRPEYLAKLAAYNQAMEKWQRSYFCRRCGNIFEL
jgi:hypothetical protein